MFHIASSAVIPAHPLLLQYVTQELTNVPAPRLDLLFLHFC